MKRKHNLRKIKTKRSYTSEELAETLGIHAQTVREWKRNGLKPLEENTSPHLFLGNEIKRFLTNLSAKHKVQLKSGEFYCLSCRKGVKPSSFETIHRGITIGNSRESLILRAKCPECSKTINRFSSDALEKQVKKLEVISEENSKELEKDSISLFDQIEN